MMTIGRVGPHRRSPTPYSDSAGRGCACPVQSRGRVAAPTTVGASRRDGASHQAAAAVARQAVRASERCAHRARATGVCGEGGRARPSIVGGEWVESLAGCQLPRLGQLPGRSVAAAPPRERPVAVWGAGWLGTTQRKGKPPWVIDGHLGEWPTRCPAPRPAPPSPHRTRRRRRPRPAPHPLDEPPPHAHPTAALQLSSPERGEHPAAAGMEGPRPRRGPAAQIPDPGHPSTRAAPPRGGTVADEHSAGGGRIPPHRPAAAAAPPAPTAKPMGGGKRGWPALWAVQTTAARARARGCTRGRWRREVGRAGDVPDCPPELVHKESRMAATLRMRAERTAAAGRPCYSVLARAPAAPLSRGVPRPGSAPSPSNPHLASPTMPRSNDHLWGASPHHLPMPRPAAGRGCACRRAGAAQAPAAEGRKGGAGGCLLGEEGHPSAAAGRTISSPPPRSTSAAEVAAAPSAPSPPPAADHGWATSKAAAPSSAPPPPAAAVLTFPTSPVDAPGVAAD